MRRLGEVFFVRKTVKEALEMMREREKRTNLTARGNNNSRRFH